ncbi:MAG: hypothetical protein WDN27_02025 [Candidatus Saccharibacteria bacterium]
MNAGELAYAIVKAKKRAEYDPNVGDMSTLVSIRKNVEWITDDKLRILWKEYDTSVRQITAKISKASQNMMGELYGAII